MDPQAEEKVSLLCSLNDDELIKVRFVIEIGCSFSDLIRVIFDN